jgi:hypothetical protein
VTPKEGNESVQEKNISQNILNLNKVEIKKGMNSIKKETYNKMEVTQFCRNELHCR